MRYPIPNALLEGFTIQNGRAANELEYDCQTYWMDCHGGGIIANNGAAVTLKNLIIQNNFASHGAGMFIQDEVTISNVIVRNNTGLYGGSALEAWNYLVVENMLVYGNSGGNAAILNSGTGNGDQRLASVYKNVTIVNNETSGLEVSSEHLIVMNSIIYGNNTSTNETANEIISEMNEQYDYNIYIYNSLIANGINGVSNFGGNLITDWDESNISSEPDFIDATNNNFKLEDTSPAIGNGSLLVNINEIQYIAPSYDLNNSDRPFPAGSNPDIGAYENALGTPIILGCTDPEATNYDPDATIDDGSCEYLDIEATLSIGEIDLASQTIEINLENSAPVSGFQFLLSSADSVDFVDVYGGSAEENGFTVDIGGNNIVLGFSLSATEIPTGNDVLTIVEFNGFTSNDICISEGVITSGYEDAQYFDVSYGDCISPYLNGDVNMDGVLDVLDIVTIINIIFETIDPDDYQLWASDYNSDGDINIMDIVQIVNAIFSDDVIIEGCMDDTACNYDESANVDDGSCAYEVDCAGECGGSAIIDECGVCGGDGSSCSSTVCDIDGNCYETIQIGEQLWMAENLKVTKYRDGSYISSGHTDEEWGQLETGAYAAFDDDPANADIYGILYNWFAVDDMRGLCPDGWHIPSDSEWTILTDYLDGVHVAGGKIKSTGTIEDGDGLWYDPNMGATNEVGFSALPGGYRMNGNGSFLDLGKFANFWSSTPFWFKAATYLENGLQGGSYFPVFGFSIRCVAD